ncbi:MAG: hypothetical protein R2867_18580 [Caldilineaceae bacterium]
MAMAPVSAAHLEQALAIAILDATLQLQDAARWSGLQAKVSHFVEEQAAAQQLADCELLRKVEATRVEMEVF